MKRAVSSMDACAWGVRQQGSEKEVVRLKRCKSAFANLKQLAATNAHAAATFRRGGGAPSIFVREDPAAAAASISGKDQQPTGPRWRQFFDHHDACALNSQPQQQPQQQQQPGELRLESRGPNGHGRGAGPFVFGSTWPPPAERDATAAPAGHPHRHGCVQPVGGAVSAPSAVATATERRLFGSSGSISSSSSGGGGGGSALDHGGGGGVSFPSRRHNSFVSSSFTTCSTVHEHQHHHLQQESAVDSSPDSSSSSSPATVVEGAAARCPFLQQRQLHQQRRRQEDEEEGEEDRAAGGLAAPIEAASTSSGGDPSASNPALGGRLGFRGWMSDPAGGAGSPPGFSIVGFGVEVDDDADVVEDEGYDHHHHVHHQRLLREGEEEEEEEGGVQGEDGLSESPSTSPMLLLRLQRRFEDMLLVT